MKRWMFPPGYNSKAATRRLAQLETGPNTSQDLGVPRVDTALDSLDLFLRFLTTERC
jgi:hypothetical protein